MRFEILKSGPYQTEHEDGDWCLGFTEEDGYWRSAATGGLGGCVFFNSDLVSPIEE